MKETTNKIATEMLEELLSLPINDDEDEDEANVNALIDRAESRLKEVGCSENEIDKILEYIFT